MDMNQTLDQAIPRESKYLTKEDCGEDGINVTIAGFDQVDVSQANQPEERRVIVLFDGIKPLVLNQTNKSRLKAIYQDCDRLAEFIGKRINVYSDPFVEFGGKVVGGIRIRKATDAPAGNALADKIANTETSKKIAAGEKASGFDDDIPF